MLRRITPRTVAALAVTILCLGLVQKTSLGESKKPVHHTVEIRDAGFFPTKIEVKPGDTITWINLDIVPHTATAMDKSWNTRKIDSGKKATVTVPQDFSVLYQCLFHPGMKGLITPPS